MSTCGPSLKSSIGGFAMNSVDGMCLLLELGISVSPLVLRSGKVTRASRETVRW